MSIARTAGWGIVACVCGTGLLRPASPALSALHEPPPAAKAAAPTDAMGAEILRRLDADVRPLLAKFCYECHSTDVAKSGIVLDTIGSMRDVAEQAKALAAAREMIASHEMPPKGRSAPTDHQRLILDQWLESALSYVPPDAPIDPGWFTIHRLNRDEYRNTMRDLLGISVASFDPADLLPKDDTGYGFDNNADVLSVSPLAVERYLDAAERCLDYALGPIVEIGSTPRAVALTSSGNGNTLPGGGIHLYSNGSASGVHSFPVTGEYRVSVVAWEDRGGDEHARLSLRLDGRELRSFDVDASRDTPREYYTTIRVEVGKHSLAAHFTNDYWKKDVADRNLGVESINVAGPLDERTTERPASWHELFGPAKQPAAPGKDEAARAAEIIERFATRAYRAPLSPAQRDSLASFFRARFDQATGPTAFERAVRDTLGAVLVSPSFLYRSVANPKPDEPAHVYTLGEHELASRLSYFLWSSTPDDRLRSLADDGTLTQDDVLRREVVRMLDDERSGAFVRNFVGQWLQLRSLSTIEIDRSKFPAYTDDLRQDMTAEASMFFADVLSDRGTVLDLLSSDHTFVNERLAELYGISGVRGNSLRRVGLAPGSARGGVLTMAGVLTITSNTTRTSPVKRGLFVLDQILGTPPPPPPADIPPLEQSAHDRPGATLREQLAVHVANPTCAACHNRLDPLGLAFENFDAIGRWRDAENGSPIDASGTLPGPGGGTPLAGPADVKRLLLSRREQFVETLSGKVLTYATGRGLEPFDRPAVRAIAARVKDQGYRMRALVEAVVLSETFRTCRGREPRRD